MPGGGDGAPDHNRATAETAGCAPAAPAHWRPLVTPDPPLPDAPLGLDVALVGEDNALPLRERHGFARLRPVEPDDGTLVVQVGLVLLNEGVHAPALQRLTNSLGSRVWETSKARLAAHLINRVGVAGVDGAAKRTGVSGGIGLRATRARKVPGRAMCLVLFERVADLRLAAVDLGGGLLLPAAATPQGDDFDALLLAQLRHSAQRDCER